MAFVNRPLVIESGGLSPLDRAAYLIATGGGAGFAPIASGTIGSLEGVAVFLATLSLDLGGVGHIILLAALSLSSFSIGVWASSRVCALSGAKDPGQIVIDEVSGQLIALTPLAAGPSIEGVVIGFVLFRLFDVFKPYPIYKLERLRGGLGVMSDDLLAGIYTAVLVWAGHYVHLL